MEASQAVEGQQEGTEQAQGAEQDAQGQESQEGQPDLSQVFERLDKMAEDFPTMLDERLAPFEQPFEEPQQQQGPDELQQVLDSDDPDPAQARQVLDRMVEAKASEMLGPLYQEIAEMRAERGGEKLMEKYPEFQDSEKAEKAVNDAYGLAMNLTRGNEELSNFLADSPEFIETAYLAGIARQRAADEQSAASEGEVELESAGGARPGQADDYDDRLRKSILEAGGGERNPLFHG